MLLMRSHRTRDCPMHITVAEQPRVVNSQVQTTLTIVEIVHLPVRTLHHFEPALKLRLIMVWQVYNALRLWYLDRILRRCSNGHLSLLRHWQALDVTLVLPLGRRFGIDYIIRHKLNISKSLSNDIRNRA